jgi:hypothetical protein
LSEALYTEAFRKKGGRERGNGEGEGEERGEERGKREKLTLFLARLLSQGREEVITNVHGIDVYVKRYAIFPKLFRILLTFVLEHNTYTLHILKKISGK